MPGLFIQNIGTAVQTAAATTLAITVAEPVAKFDMVLVHVGYNLNGGVAPSISIADSRGNGYNFSQQNSDGEATPTIQLCEFYSRTAAGALQAGDTITVTFSVAVTGIVMSADDYTGMSGHSSATSPNDGGSANTTAVASTSPTVTNTSTSGDLRDQWTAMVLTNGPASDGYTEDANDWATGARPSIANLTLNTAYRIDPFTGATNTYAPTLGTARIWVAQAATWRPLPDTPDESFHSHRFGPF